jgi:hypothetical protein
MTYNKPEVVKLGSAVKAIRGQSKEADLNSDGTPFQIVTTPAYEADE